MRTISLGGNADLIAYAWYRLGVRPRQSLVMVGLRRSSCDATTGTASPTDANGAGSGRLHCGVVARIDLPPAPLRRQAFDDLVEVLRRHDHDAVAALVVTDRSPRSIARDVRRSLRVARMPLLDLVVVGRDRYRSLTCTDEECCPEDGRPLADVGASSMAAEMILEGHVLVDDVRDLIADVRPDPARAVHVDDGHEATDPRMLLDRWGELLAGRALPDPAPLTEPDVTSLGVGLDHLLFRDAVLVSLALPTGDDGLGAAARALRGSSRVHADAARVVPDDERLDCGRRVLAEVAARMPRGRRAPALGALAWIEWWRGDGLQARVLAEAALQDRPGHRLSVLVSHLIAAAVPPPWFDEVSAGARFSASETGCRDVAGPI
jgi:hypothetical protein